MKKVFFLVLTLIVLSTASANAQVTIGANADPHSGAILDLQSTTQGLKLPVVALSDTLTNFVLPEVGASTKDNAVGMLVYNTNPTYGEGVYSWNGSTWKPLIPLNGRSGSDLVVGPNTYPTYIFPGSIGTWMTKNSKEGNPSCDTYPGQPVGERGYYYSLNDTVGVCPSGWHVPTVNEWLLLSTFLNQNLGSNAYRAWTTYGGAGFLTLPGCDAKDLSHWGRVGYYLSTERVIYSSESGTVIMGTLTSGGAYSVRCKSN
jgi:uncharacterized protein (TIGR02145 family)